MDSGVTFVTLVPMIQREYFFVTAPLTSYNIVKASITNTPEIIANNKFVGKITLVPASVAEEIEFQLQVTPQGVTLT